jgi:hypothetical protein
MCFEEASPEVNSDVTSTSLPSCNSSISCDGVETRASLSLET